MFLDPFGNQVKWETLDRIGRTPGIDLWYLFPAGLGVLRQISRDGRVQKDAEASLDLLFGPNDWRGNLISRQPNRTCLVTQLNWPDEWNRLIRLRAT